MISDESDVIPPLNLEDLHDDVRVAEDLIRHGFYREAVQKAAERFNVRVAILAERPDLSGSALANTIFSEDKPLLAFSEERQYAAERDIHNGFRFLSLGLNLGVRNLYTHVIDLPVERTEAFEWLSFMSAMHRRLDRTTQSQRSTSLSSAETSDQR